MSSDRSPGEWNLAVRLQEAVAHLGQVGLESSDLEAVLREAMVVASDALAVGHVGLFELLPDGKRLRGRAGIDDGKVMRRRSMAKLVIPSGRGSLPGYVMEAGTSVVSEDLVGDPRFTALAPERGIDVRAALASPISSSDGFWGVLVVYDASLRRWTDDEVHFVQSIANTMGLAIQRSGIERALRDSSTRLDLSLAAGGFGAWSWAIDDDEVELSPSALTMYGLTEAAFDGTGEAFLAVTHPDDRATLRDDVYRALETNGEQHHLVRIIRQDTGEVRWIEIWGRIVDDHAGHQQMVGVTADVTDRRRAEQAKEAMLASEHQARLDAEAARERLAFLAGASARLSSSLDVAVTLETLVDLCVPYLADVCLIDLIDDDGNLAEAAGRAVDQQSLDDVRELRRRRAALGGVGGVYSERLVALHGETVIHTVLVDADYEAASSDEEHLAVFRRFGCHSVVVAPLLGRSGVRGVLSLLFNRPGRSYDHDDLALIEEFATRATLAIDNGLLFHSRNRVARSLQDALLPPAMPRIPGIELAARYDVAEADVAIGGDFYDVIPIAPGSWGMVVGDVCGRGPDAAALTGLVRHSVRAAVVREQLPSRVLAHTNEAMLQQIDDSRFCTAAYLSVELDPECPSTVRVGASSAGHPRPVLVRADGRAEALECSGTLLGVVAEPALVDIAVELAPGDAVVLYTDGVTEARRGTEQFGEDRLVAALAALAGGTAEELASGLEHAVAGFRRSARDDMAILVVQVVAPA